MRTAEQVAERDYQIAAMRERLREKEEAKRSADRAWPKTPRGRASSRRATAKYQRTHKKKLAARQKRYLARKKLRDGSRKFIRIRPRRPNTTRDPASPRIVLSGTDSILTLDQLQHPRFIVYSPGRPRTLERLPYDDPLSTELPP